MKIYIRLAALLGLLILTGCPDPNPEPVLEPDCVEIVHLSFDGSLFDSSANNFSANASDTVKYAKDRFANNNGAAYLDGSATITIPSSPKLDFQPNSEYSISVWVRTRDTADASIVAKGGDAPVPGYSLQLRNGRPAAIFTGNTTPIEVMGTKSIADNIWHLLTLSVSKDSIHLYADTTLVASGSASQLAPQKNKKGPLYIGKLPNATKPFIGHLDNVVFRPCPQDQSQVSAARNNGVRSPGIIAMGDMPPGITKADYHGILDVSWPTEEIGYACGTDGRLLTTSNAGNTWLPTLSTPATSATRFEAISFYDQNKGSTIDANGNIYVTANGGQTWATVVPSRASTDPQLPPTPALLSATIMGMEFVDPTSIVIVGYGDWYSGGPGFIYSMNHTTGIVSSLESSSVDEFCMLAVAKSPNPAQSRILAFSASGDVRRYNISSTTQLQPTISMAPNTIAHSADLVLSSGSITGLVGTRYGQVWRYTESPVGQTPIVAHEANVLPSQWVIGTRVVAAPHQVRAIGSGTTTVASGTHVNSLKYCSGNLQSNATLSATQAWSESTLGTAQAVTYHRRGSSGYVILNGTGNPPNHGLPGYQVQ